MLNHSLRLNSRRAQITRSASDHQTLVRVSASFFSRRLAPVGASQGEPGLTRVRQSWGSWASVTHSRSSFPDPDIEWLTLWG